MSGRIDCERQGGMARVVLRHPQRMNAMTRAMWQQLRAVFRALQQERDLRLVLIAGEGGHFCAGGDIAEYADFRFQTESLRDFHEREVWGALSAMLDCDLPIVAQIEGNCMGAGLEIACCCDIRWAAADSHFGAPIARLGFPMAPREAELVARVAGQTTVREMLLAAEILSAETLLQRGFLHRLCDPSELNGQLRALCDRICALAPGAARQNKRTLRALAEEGPTALPGLIMQAYDYADSAEHREGVGAFMAKRSPRFS
ncbi:MAG: enoyl-CoA hydratase/isomerase family protein [Betaproteobacteria bacterium]|nr:enoyl-CoA hydratase/isomerase family protein [Betaproteobacteria bacterium]